MGVALVAAGLRGSLGRRPVQLKDAAVCGDALLDKLVPNPFSALRYALLQHRLAGNPANLRAILPGGDIGAAARGVNPGKAHATSVDELLQRSAAGLSVRKPQHLFLIVMESYDA